MNLLVIGGPTRNIGKTSLACGLIHATADRRWTAVKISLFGHGVCSTSGKPCGCAVADVKHPFALSVETNDDGGTDTSRMLRAGAREVLWLRAPQGRLDEALPLLEQALDGRENVIIESNSIVDFLEPTVFLQIWDDRAADVKASARRLLARADALAVVGSGPPAPQIPRFPVAPPGYCSPGLTAFVAARIEPSDRATLTADAFSTRLSRLGARGRRP